MAANRFQHYKVTPAPNTNGRGGHIEVNTNEDTIAQVSAAAWWASDLSATDRMQDRDARKELEDFVAGQQNPNESAGQGLPIMIKASDGLEWDVAALVAGRIQIRGGSFNVT